MRTLTVNKKDLKHDLSVFPNFSTNGRKSFNGKAKVIVENGVAKLLSYSTFVAEYNTETKEYKENGTYSKTTNNHIKAFKHFYGL